MLAIGLLFCLILAAILSTYPSAGKRWWGTHGYRVRIIRRNCGLGLGAASALWLALYLPGRLSPIRIAVPGTPASIEAPAWSAPDAPIPGLRTTIGVEEARQAADDTPDQLRCGAERWSVKTLSDADSDKVSFQPVPTTITQLAALPAPTTLPNDRRIAPVELTTYVVRARLLGFKRESDDDFHLVIAEPADRNKTMIAEIPAPGCSKAQALLAPPRREFVDLFGRVSLSWSWSEPSSSADLVEITGVGFYDFDHGQNGVAPNAIELHPVLAIRRIRE